MPEVVQGRQTATHLFPVEMNSSNILIVGLVTIKFPDNLYKQMKVTCTSKVFKKPMSFMCMKKWRTTGEDEQSRAYVCLEYDATNSEGGKF